jgi:hypothetical protein
MKDCNDYENAKKPSETLTMKQRVRKSLIRIVAGGWMGRRPRVGVRFFFVVSAVAIASCATAPQTQQPTTNPPVAAAGATGKQPQITTASFDELWKGVEQDTAQPAGQAWERANNSELEHTLSAAETRCGVSPLDLAGFGEDLYFIMIVGSDGRVRASTSRPSLERVDCIRAGLAQARFTAPPWDGYRFGIQVAVPKSSGDRRPLPESATFAEGFTRFLADSNTQEGVQWITAHMAEIGPALTPLMQVCPGLAQRLMQGEASVVFELASDGSIRRALWDGAMGEADCGNAQLAHVRLPPPPFDGYWFGVVSRPQ